MQRSQTERLEAPHKTCNPMLTLGGRVSQRTTLTVLAVAAVASGLVLGWDSLAAAGLSGLVLAVLPCAAMCALGLCAGHLGRKDAGDTGAGGTIRKEASSFRPGESESRR